MSIPSQSEKAELLEIYKLHAELADRVSQRREGANRLYVSIITGFLVAVMVFSRLGLDRPIELSWLLCVGGFLGIGLCASWYIVIRSYRQLNSGKFRTLHELESKLSYPFFQREWELLKSGDDFKTYWRLTIAETVLPIIFGLAYLVLVVIGFYHAT